MILIIRQSVLIKNVSLHYNFSCKNMDKKKVTFENLPQIIAGIVDKLNELECRIDTLAKDSKHPISDHWMDLQELRDYLPTHPATQTVYGWTSCNLIPFHKKGKRIFFVKDEIDIWYLNNKLKMERNM